MRGLCPKHNVGIMGKPVKPSLRGERLVLSHIKSFPKIHTKMHFDIPVLYDSETAKLTSCPGNPYMLFLELIEQMDSPALQWTEVKCSH